MTTRKDVEGTLARWLAIDAESHIGIFTGPYAAWPASVFEDYPTVDAASEFLATVPPTTEAIISKSWREAGKDPMFPTLEASRGLYSFDADPGYGGQTVYYLDASPLHPLLESEAHPLVRRAATLVRFSNVRFADVEQIDLQGLVPFVVGKG